MEILILSVLAFIITLLTFFSGFGLGTLMTPVFMLFFPVEVAITLTGIVHLFNNLFKLILVGRNVDWKVTKRFGIPAIIAAFIGAYLLFVLPDVEVLKYRIGGKEFSVFLIKLLVGSLIFIFSFLELLPFVKRLEFSEKWLTFGGIFSGFFGGLSGNQGALRAAFLMKSGLSKQAFIGTTVVISTVVDFTRLGVYFTRIREIDFNGYETLLIATILSGILGSYVGNKLLKKVTLETLQRYVAVFLMLLSLALGLGLI